MWMLEKLLSGAEHVAMRETLPQSKTLRMCNLVVTASGAHILREIEIDGRWYLLQVTELPRDYSPGRDIKEVKL